MGVILVIENRMILSYYAHNHCMLPQEPPEPDEQEISRQVMEDYKQHACTQYQELVNSLNTLRRELQEAEQLRSKVNQHLRTLIQSTVPHMYLKVNQSTVPHMPLKVNQHLRTLIQSTPHVCHISVI